MVEKYRFDELMVILFAVHPLGICRSRYSAYNIALVQT
jgi:hypothetical protein